MAKKSTKKAGDDIENTCSYCLFFQSYRAGRILQGNCAYYKEWIENASSTTCSDMSNRPLKDKGIYRLVVNDDTGGLSYVRRENKLRTRLFLIKGSRD